MRWATEIIWRATPIFAIIRRRPRKSRMWAGPVNPNLEEIVALMPDLVLATSINRRETVNALDRIGLPVYRHRSAFR